MATKTNSYAIIAGGGKQYVVREGERLLVDRVRPDEAATFQPGVLFAGGIGGGRKRPKPAREAPAEQGDEPAARPPSGYADYTIADIVEKSKRWRLEQA